MQISGNAALVTGAGSGLGASTARALAEAGAKVYIADRDAAAAEQVASEIQASGNRSAALAFDVADADAVTQAIDSIDADEVPRIIVNCAGIGSAARVLPRSGELTVDVFERTLRVNLLGSYTVLNVAARRIAQLDPVTDDGERGVIINTASVAYQDGQIGQAAYAASKGGIASMTLPIARELARVGIRVMTIAPGLFETAMTAGLPEEVQASLGQSIPFPSRLARPEEFASTARHIVENSALNGEVIRLDGALRLPPR